MPARPLPPSNVERIWGRKSLPNWCGTIQAGQAPIGEIWFGDPVDPDPRLLVKYLFTSQRLSIQVHPDDNAARERGYRRGKSEAWFILDAEPGAVIGLGLKKAIEPAELRKAALDGSIEGLIDWQPARAGELLYSPAGTIHAIGAGVSLIEIQQNLDVTYRLYDYGRPRELHLDDGIDVAELVPYRKPASKGPMIDGRQRLAATPAFTIERWRLEGSRRVCETRELLVIPLDEGGTIDGRPMPAGSVWRVDGDAALEAARPAELLVAYPAGSDYELR